MHPKIALLTACTFFGVWQGIQLQVEDQYSRNSFSREVGTFSIYKIKMFRIAGWIFGPFFAYQMLCVDRFLIFDTYGIQFNKLFLTIHSDNELNPDLHYHEVLAKF